jgi:glycosyltransferase involved in cell wall biosynthesis
MVEWCNDAAVWLSRYGPKRSRLAIRLHSYEERGPWPVAVDWSRVDALIFVAEHVRDRLFCELRLDKFPHLDTAVIPVPVQTARFNRSKQADAWTTLGMVGWGKAGKDPLKAIEILGSLRAVDKRWRLRLLGHAPRPWTRSEREYFHRLRGAADELGPGSVSLDPWTHDVPEWLTGVGYVLSTSRSEGFHKAAAEAMASGAIPVVRRWPASRSWHGAERQYPNALLSDDPDDAAAQILELSADPDAVAGKASQAAREARERFDSAVVLPRLTAVILGRDDDVGGLGEPGAVRRRA